MKLDPPEKVSEQQLTISVNEIEPLLQAPPMNLPKWPECILKIRDGRIMYLREATLDDAPQMLNYLKKVMDVDHDFYDIVGARCYAEILGWVRNRLKDPFNIIGTINGEWAGFANGRVMNEDIAISLHTMALARRCRAGWVMYYAKTYYAMEVLGANEWWSTFESYNGWRMAGLEMAQPSYPWPEYQHELGGARVFYVTKKYWDTVLKDYSKQMIGAELDFDVPDSVRNANANFHVPEEIVL